MTQAPPPPGWVWVKVKPAQAKRIPVIVDRKEYRLVPGADQLLPAEVADTLKNSGLLEG